MLMKSRLLLRFMLCAASCLPGPAGRARAAEDFKVVAEQFADIEVLRYQAPEFDQLTLPQKKLAYFLTEAGLAGRDIFYDQRYQHNLLVRKTLEGILTSWKGDKTSVDYQKFLVYAKRVFFSNGIHHHYSNIKLVPEFSFEFFQSLLSGSDPRKLPLEGKSAGDLARFLRPIIFDPKVDPKVVDLTEGIDHIKGSAVNFYEGVTQDEVEKFYAGLARENRGNLLPLGLNSKVVRKAGQVQEQTWKIGGMYGRALERVVYWLKQAMEVAENESQRAHLKDLVRYYETGDLQAFNDHCIKWVGETSARIDVVNGFIEVYQDPMQKKGSFESVVSMRDLEATRRITAISREAQWFEDHSPIAEAHKKKGVVGISAKVITVLGEVGDSAPATPVGINLPNADWIREKHGSKSVMAGNIMAAYNYVKARSPATEEFAPTPEVAARIKKHGALASNLHVDMHEVIGHASGKLNSGIGTPDKTLKTYAGTLEEARADLVALYYAIDPKLVEIGVMPSPEVGQAEYDAYILNGLLMQLYKVKPGENLEEAHMRNRQLVAGWAFEQGRGKQVIEKFVRDGKTYFKVNDYQQLRELFGRLLREIQRIKSEGDYEAAKNLVEKYGVTVDQKLLTEVHARFQPLKIAPYQGFIQPRLVPVKTGMEITDVRIEYPEDFLGQMLEYGEKYSFLPIRN